MRHNLNQLDVSLVGVFEIREIIAKFAVKTDFSVIIKLHDGKSGRENFRE